jgi:hypothetical protein
MKEQRGIPIDDEPTQSEAAFDEQEVSNLEEARIGIETQIKE